MKKLSLFLLALCLVLCLVACTKPVTDPDDTTAEPTETTSASNADGTTVTLNSVAVQNYYYSDKLFHGALTITTKNTADGSFIFSTSCSDPVTVDLKTGENTITVPCYFERLGQPSGTDISSYNPTVKVSFKLEPVDGGTAFETTNQVYLPINEFKPIELDFSMPSYRMDFFPGQDYSKVKGTIVSDKPVTLKLEGPGIETQTVTTDKNGNFSFDTKNFEIGAATLTMYIDGFEIGKETIRRLAPSEHTMTWVSEGNLIVNGEAVLRRNLYADNWHGGVAFDHEYNADENLSITQVLRESNSVRIIPVSYFSGSKYAEMTGNYVPSDEMYKRLDELIEKNKNRDFTYYFFADEPFISGVNKFYMKNIYDYMVEKDPYHVLYIAEVQMGPSLEVADWVELEGYVAPLNTEDGRVYSKPFSETGISKDGYTIEELCQAYPDKCIGFIGSTYKSYALPEADYPNFEEILCNMWRGLIRGAKSLSAYAYHDINDRPALHEGMRYVFSSVEALQDLLLHGYRSVIFSNDNVEAVLFDNVDEKMFVLVNMTPEPQKITLPAITGTWYEFRHGRTITGNTFELKPLEVIIGTSKVMDEGLPTYDETVALIESLEYERTHRGSLLFGRENDVTVTASANHCNIHKLMDGVIDNLGLSEMIASAAEKYFEMNLTTVKPTVNKIVIHGAYISSMTMKLKIGDTWVEPATSEVTVEQWSRTYVLAEPVSPDALRLEFASPSVQLFEIEFF